MLTSLAAVRLVGRRCMERTAEAVWSRAEPRYCAGCKRRALNYVYLQNHKDYCACARDVMREPGIRPAGRRQDDITNLD